MVPCCLWRCVLAAALVFLVLTWKGGIRKDYVWIKHFFSFPLAIFFPYDSCVSVLETYFQINMLNTFSLGCIPLVMSLLYTQRDYLLSVDSTSCFLLQWRLPRKLNTLRWDLFSHWRCRVFHYWWDSSLYKPFMHVRAMLKVLLPTGFRCFWHPLSLQVKVHRKPPTRLEALFLKKHNPYVMLVSKSWAGWAEQWEACLPCRQKIVWTLGTV